MKLEKISFESLKIRAKQSNELVLKITTSHQSYLPSRRKLISGIFLVHNLSINNHLNWQGKVPIPRAPDLPQGKTRERRQTMKPQFIMYCAGYTIHACTEIASLESALVNYQSSRTSRLIVIVVVRGGAYCAFICTRDDASKHQPSSA